MGQDENLTPEKQLLKLIEDPSPEKVKAEAQKRKKGKAFSLDAFKGRLAFWKSFAQGRRPAGDKPRATFSFPTLSFRKVNVLLRISILFLSLYLGYSVVAMGIELRKTAHLIFQPERRC